MEVTFESTLDGETEVTIEAIRRLSVWQQGYLLGSLMAGALAGVVVAFIVQGGLLMKTIVAVLVGGVATAFAYWRNLKTQLKTVRKRVEKERAKRRSHTTTVLITPEAMEYVADEISARFEWSRIAEIIVRNNRILFVAASGGIASAPLSAFDSRAAFGTFVEETRRLAAEGGGPALVEEARCPACGATLATFSADPCPACGAALLEPSARGARSRRP